MVLVLCWLQYEFEEFSVSFRVLVLERGEIAEFDCPSKLISQKRAFYKMAKDAGLV